MDDYEIEKISKELFDILDRDKSNTLSKGELSNHLRLISDKIDTQNLTDKIFTSFDLNEKEIS